MSTHLKPGDPAPDFEAATTDGHKVSLGDYRGKKLILYFYPRDDTPGCTDEGKQFRDLHAKFVNARVPVFGVSRDTIASHEKFKKKMSFPFELLSDADEKLCGIFAVMKQKNMYGRQVRGIERSTFVIDREGRIAKEWRGVKVPGHAQEVLDYIRSTSL